ncbi:hypothetical protein PHYSODRAFT_335705 [Phytophthora sojae]|uniref:Uncharacterized protein n=1 Tax=Phytophthora sojae (strain P6497) TaxID=1094619 RepID=G4ZSE6_PHYSP|nr:hypothetical protein PHYSODRAFT_335705 [Phytophthora sojae]EGZ14026.1 hypothetical protein PHYSODRAFT_335705 [Phytophthora sojae]|eukprot:XP_009531455.1 hypothetical protein PHYSODRAFT_335705 [Phytophthora sojae]
MLFDLFTCPVGVACGLPEPRLIVLPLPAVPIPDTPGEGASTCLVDHCTASHLLAVGAILAHLGVDTTTIMVFVRVVDACNTMGDRARRDLVICGGRGTLRVVGLDETWLPVVRDDRDPEASYTATVATVIGSAMSATRSKTMSADVDSAETEKTVTSTEASAAADKDMSGDVHPSEATL